MRCAARADDSSAHICVIDTEPVLGDPAKTGDRARRRARGWDSRLHGARPGTMDHVHTSRTEEEASLEATIIERLGVHVEVKDVVHSTGLVMVSIHFPELPDAELLAWKEWLQTELRALAAQQSDGLVLAPYYLD